MHDFHKALNVFTSTFSQFFPCGMTSLSQGPVVHTRIRIQIQRGQADKLYSGSVDALIESLEGKQGRPRLFLIDGYSNIFRAFQNVVV